MSSLALLHVGVRFKDDRLLTAAFLLVSLEWTCKLYFCDSVAIGGLGLASTDGYEALACLIVGLVSTSNRVVIGGPVEL